MIVSRERVEEVKRDFAGLMEAMGLAASFPDSIDGFQTGAEVRFTPGPVSGLRSGLIQFLMRVTDPQAEDEDSSVRRDFAIFIEPAPQSPGRDLILQVPLDELAT